MKKFLIFICILLVHYDSIGQTVWTNKTKLKGKIGKYEIMMTLAVPFGGASSCFTIGEYYYVSMKKSIDLCSEDDEKIVETVDGKETGYFVIKDWDKKVGEKVNGTWYSMNGRKSYPVQLVVIAKAKN